ncbi:MAG: YbaN family protein [Alphaproteobacteria bacterium]|nr:YbaN family protein [Alphaproteobacteria bacterium]
MSILEQSVAPSDTRRPPAAVRAVLLAFGLLCTGLGVVGVILPGLPGTVFLILAAWAFARSNERLDAWLQSHPRFGPVLRAWRRDRSIPRRAKRAAVGLMAFSLAGLVWLAGGFGAGVFAAAGAMTCVSAWIVTRPEPPAA